MGRRAYTKTQKVQKFLERNAGAKPSEIAKATGVDLNYVYVIKHKLFKAGDVVVKRKPKARIGSETVSALGDGLFKGVSGKLYKPMDFTPQDMVNSPSHYKVGGIETIDFIEAKNLGYHLGNAVKYISRADHKGRRSEDLEKAKWYLDREIKRLSA